MMSNDRDVRMLQMEEDQTLQVQKKTKKIYTKEIKAAIYKLVERESLDGTYGSESWFQKKEASLQFCEEKRI